jgi:2-haloacid dehalogenase
MDFSRFTAISFDCYGTLIDWESGILPVLRGVLAEHGRQISDASALELYGEFEAKAEGGRYRRYRNVLESVIESFAEHFDFTASPSELGSLHQSVPEWKPFPDTVVALQRLKTRYKLAIISNIDNDLFAATQAHLGVQFDAVVTAEQAKGYKPSPNNFELALGTLGLAKDRLLHAGQSIYHDIVPARSLGISSVWVNRKSARPGIGAVRLATGQPDLEVPDLATLAKMAVPGKDRRPATRGGPT